MKICAKCKESKSPKEFHKDKIRPDGLFPYCKFCRKIPRKPAYQRPIEVVLSDYLVSKLGCWEWSGVINRDGYGMACYQGLVVRAHRLSILHSLGIDSSDLLALHHCDNRRCINPEHIYLGTNQDNSSDMVRRDRSSKMKGELHPLSKITEVEVIEIRADTRRHKVIAIDYGIAASTVSSIKNGKTWSHLSKVTKKVYLIGSVKLKGKR